MTQERLLSLIRRYEAVNAPTVFRLEVLRDLYELFDGIREIPRLRR